MDETFKNLKNVYKKFGKDYKKNLIKIIVFSLIGLFTNICIPLLSASLIVNFTNSEFEQVMYMALVMFSVFTIDAIKVIFIRKNNMVFRRGVVRNIQMSLGREILKLEQFSLDENSSGTFIHRLSSDTEKMSRIFTNGMVLTIKLLSSIGAFIAILIINWRVFLFYLVASLILTLMNYVKHEKMGEKDKEYRRESERVAGLTGELVRGSRDIKMLGAKDSFMDKLDEVIISQNEKEFEMRNIDIRYNFVITIVKLMFEVSLVLFLVMLIQNKILSVAIALALFNYRTQVLNSFMENVSQILEECKNFNISSERVFAIIGNKEFKKEKFGSKSIDQIKGDFEFKNVTFGYNENLVLKKLNLKIDSGKTYGIVGMSGSGKTTIFNLVCKLYSINEGKIYIDGIDIEELDEKSIRENITIINQNPYIFNMSINDNLRLVKKDVTDKEIVEACKIACLDDFVETLPNKYDTIVGEGGVTLSGGQRQRLAIARALIQNTKIILFDEATSALDNETQSKIQNAIENLKGDYTIIIIAHRLSTIVNCDKIFILDDGKIIDSGKHKELIKSNKYYKKLCETELVEKDK